MTSVLLLIVGAGWVWSVLALRYFHRAPAVLRLPLVGAYALQPFVTEHMFGGDAAMVLTPVLALPVVAAWIRIRPRLDLEWAPDQSRLPVADFDGSTVHVNNVRYARYRTRTDYDVHWERRSYDLNAIRTVDFIVNPFGVLFGMAHTFVSFGFEDGRHVSISVEVRRERPEIFGPIKGLFRQYELMYVVGDERDVIGLRANVRRDAVHVYPVRATRTQARRLFVSMLSRANSLAEMPEFYNTLFNNCATNILDHVNELTRQPFAYTLRVAVPGFSARFAYDQGLIDTELPFEEARRRFRINARSAFPVEDFEAEGRSWSAQIRATA